MRCPACDFETDEELDMLAHLVECPNKPESKWRTYVDMVRSPFKNSDIVEEGEK